MKRLIILFAVMMTAFIVGAYHPAKADASITCPLVSLNYPNPNSDTVSEGWAIQCNGAKWNVEFMLQYESSGVWHNADCVNTHPCDIWRPSQTTNYDAGSQHGGTVTFDVVSTAGCGVRWRVHATMWGAGGNVVGPISSPISAVC